ncbi:hypothetical protein [Microbacterium sp.]|uniref:DUF7144 family membrane protein n=1 Tax=Microbacterium sp. TaxID=51671 RepID=UPI0037C6BE0C
MNQTTVARPANVTVAGVLLIIFAALQILMGILALVGGGAVAASMNDTNGGIAGAIAIVGGFILVVGVLNLIFAIGVLRGSNVARWIVTILQLLSIAGGIYSLVSGGQQLWQGLANLIIPVLILVLLWVGERTRAFFAKA